MEKEPDYEIEITEPKPYMGRKVVIEKQFKVDGTFQSTYAANEWCLQNGYSWGSSCAMEPTGLIKGDYYATDLPHKWKNFTTKQKKSVHGVMTGDSREGPVFVRIFEHYEN